MNISYNFTVQYLIVIVDVLGIVVFIFRAVVSKIDVSGLNNGVYFIQIMGENQAFSSRFTIQK